MNAQEMFGLILILPIFIIWIEKAPGEHFG